MLKYLTIAKTGLFETLFFPKRLITIMLVMPFRMLVVSIIYKYAFSVYGGTINNIDANTAIWSISLYFLLLYVQFRAIFSDVNMEVKSGDIEVRINKPYNIFLYKFFYNLGKNTPVFLVALAAVTPLLYFLTGGFPRAISGLDLLGFALLFTIGSILSGLMYFLMSLGSFWTEDAQPFFWLFDKGVMILGGSYVPVAIMPETFRNLAIYLPFGAPILANRLFNPEFSTDWLFLLAVQLLWLVFFAIFTSLVLKKALTKVSVNGG